jgi:hypothetical protein
MWPGHWIRTRKLGKAGRDARAVASKDAADKRHIILRFVLCENFWELVVGLFLYLSPGLLLFLGTALFLTYSQHTCWSCANATGTAGRKTVAYGVARIFF